MAQEQYRMYVGTFRTNERIILEEPNGSKRNYLTATQALNALENFVKDGKRVSIEDKVLNAMPVDGSTKPKRFGEKAEEIKRKYAKA